MLTPRQIKKRLREKKLFQADIARDLGVHRALVCMTIARRRNSERLRQAIADALELPYEIVWVRGDKERAEVARLLGMPAKRKRGAS